MSKYIIRSGELRHPITIEKLESINNVGFVEEKWSVIFTTRAKINNTTGKEFIVNNSVNSSITTKFIIRCNRNYYINTKDRIVFNNNIYNIKYINNILENNTFLEIVAEKVD